jgi:hypothetical protein
VSGPWKAIFNFPEQAALAAGVRATVMPKASAKAAKIAVTFFIRSLSKVEISTLR